ncbi:MAG: cyclopropane-fatty-acyl-phospholipid synthase family protein [Candidatus Melainabacteria bacterium]|nr:cyclopropane-fatty-acyl-phospholipid synthase family protein [Candidatus Melainabacteria bacterium]
MTVNWIYSLLETNRVPDCVIRWGIRRMLAAKIRGETLPSLEQQQERLTAFIQELCQSPIAIETDAANQQHYEVPSQFFQHVLGPRLKYSSGYWAPETKTLAQAEETMLALTCERARVANGQTILDLGCGWGSLSLWLAEKYPQARIVGLSNSKTQRAFIEARAQERGFHNLSIVTANIATLEALPEPFAGLRFDRILSVEMFEHMKNYPRLLAKLAGWMQPEALLFVHIFTHRTLAYHYEDRDGSDWLTRYFFTGGTMPSHDLLLHFQDALQLIHRWAVDGTHYEKTANAWLANMDQQRANVWPLLAQTYGEGAVRRWWVYWRVFFLACAELWGYEKGQQWLVSHYLFKKPS